MAIILYLETATSICSVSLARDETLIGIHETEVSNSHSELITVFVQELLTKTGVKINDLDAVAVSKGPGSYTGLRIGVSTAKGLCYALNKPLISISTLQAMAYGADSGFRELEKNTLLCPMIDARRMEVYYALFDGHMNEIKSDCAEVITANTFDDVLENHTLLLLGDGAEKCLPLFTNQPRINCLNDFAVSARFMIKPGLQKFNNQQFENVAYFEPYYLKDFVAAKPVVKGLRT